MIEQEKIDLIFENIDRACQKLVDDLSISNNKSKTPNSVFHYTSDFGVKGILESKKLFLSDAYNLNDPSELRHGISILANFLEKKKANHLIFEHLNEGYSKFVKNIENLPHAYCYILSFSLVGDDLSQWRAYADNGRGYSIEFETKPIEVEFLKGNEKNRATYYIKYDEKEFENINKKFINSSAKIIEIMRYIKLGDKVYSDYINKLLKIYALYTIRASLFFKHSAYHNEKEYRFLEIFPVTEPDPYQNYRRRSSNLVKYREFDLKNLPRIPIKSITIGPAADSIKSEVFIKECLKYYGYEEIKIKQSDIPYRAV